MLTILWSISYLWLKRPQSANSSVARCGFAHANKFEVAKVGAETVEVETVEVETAEDHLAPMR